MDRHPLLLWLIIVASLLPFVRRPWLFDDPSVVIASQAAAAHPLDPYTYTLDLRYPNQPNWAPGKLPSYTNPVLSAWCLGAILHLSGEHEWPLHLFFFGMAMAMLFMLRPLAAVFTLQTRTTLFCLAFSPVFFLTTLSLYPQFFYFLFYISTLFCAWKLRQAPSVMWSVTMGLALTMAALSLHEWPLLMVLLVLLFTLTTARDRWSSPLMSLGIFCLLYGSWCLWETHLYGSPHFLASMRVRTLGATYAWRAAFLPLVFLVGGVPVMAMGWRVLAQRTRAILFLLIAVMLLVFWYLVGPQGGFIWHQALMLAGFFGTGLAFLAALPYVYKEGTPLDHLLIGWFLLEFMFVQKFFTYPSEHHLLTTALPAILLSVRMVDLFPIRRRWIHVGMLALWFLSLSLARADQATARIGPRLASDVASMPGNHYYWGNCYSGFSYYLKRAGWHPYDSRVRLGTNDILLVPHNLNTQGPLVFPTGQKLVLLGQHVYTIPTIFRTISIGDSAGWYSASWGALPYTISKNPVDVFTFYRGMGFQKTRGEVSIIRYPTQKVPPLVK